MATRILVTGASGYVGSRLIARLESDPEARIRISGRDPASLRLRWPALEAVRMDVLDPASIAAAVAGADTAYYLIHSMGEGERGFEERDRIAARNFGTAARDAGVEKVVYLGGLGNDGESLSPHLASRQETGTALAQHGPPVVEFRAGVVLGADSASFRMLKDLVSRLPMMITPRWVNTRAQPIAEDDVLAYLAAAQRLEVPEQHTIVEIGGADVLSYREMMERFAALQGRRRVILPVPVLTPRLSSLWCGLVTSVPTSIARPLIDGLRNEVVVRDQRARRVFPEVEPMGFDRAVQEALRPRSR